MTDSKRDLQLVRLAVRKRWLSPEEGEDCLFLKQKFGGKYALEEILRRRAYVEEGQLEQLLLAVDGERPPRPTIQPDSGRPARSTVPVDRGLEGGEVPLRDALEAADTQQEATALDDENPYDDEVTQIAAARMPGAPTPEVQSLPESAPEPAPRAASGGGGLPKLRRPPPRATSVGRAVLPRGVSGRGPALPRSPSLRGASTPRGADLRTEPIRVPSRPGVAPASSAVVPQPLGEVDDPRVRDEALSKQAKAREGGEGTFGPYVLRRLIARGRTGTVYLAEREGLSAAVALKVLSSKAEQSHETVERFVRGAKAAQQIRSSHVVPVIEHGQLEGRHYVVMPYIDGFSLKERLEADEPPKVREALAVVRGVARALEAAHHVGIVHRDIKPASVLISRDGAVYLADFGIAKDTRSSEPAVTKVGAAVVGAPAYVSPEQAIGGTVDGRSDLYALGALLFHMLTGAPPFAGATDISVVTKHMREAPPLHRLDRALPSSLVRMVERLLAKVPDERYADAEALLADLREVRRRVRERDPDQLREQQRRQQANRRALALAALASALGLLGSGGLAVSLVRVVPDGLLGGGAPLDLALGGAALACGALLMLGALALVRRGRLPLPGSTTWLVSLRDAAGAFGASVLVGGVLIAPPSALTVLVSLLGAVVMASWLYGLFLRRTIARLRPDGGVKMLAVLADRQLQRWGALHAPLVTSLAVLSVLRFGLLAYFNA